MQKPISEELFAEFFEELRATKGGLRDAVQSPSRGLELFGTLTIDGIGAAQHPSPVEVCATSVKGNYEWIDGLFDEIDGDDSFDGHSSTERLPG
jgi:hypothetical protein